MKSTYVNSCGDCGLGAQIEITDAEGNKDVVEGSGQPAPQATVKDTLDEAKQYVNSEVPFWAKLAAAGAGILLIRKFTKRKK